MAKCGFYTLIGSASSFIFAVQLLDWYQYSHLTLCQRANKHISKNVELVLHVSLYIILVAKITSTVV